MVFKKVYTQKLSKVFLMYTTFQSCGKQFLLLSMLKTVVVLNIFCGNHDIFFQDFLNK